MRNPINATERLLRRAEKDGEFRARLLAGPEDAIAEELGVALPEGHRVQVHEETDALTHLVLPPRSKLSEEEREEARTGATSLEFLKRTMYDPAPPMRPPAPKGVPDGMTSFTRAELAKAARERIRRGLAFLETTLDERGAWHCIRFNLANPEIPRHFERPPFVSALCTLALESCREAKARAMVAAAKGYLADTIEPPGFWRYYLHLPQDLDSSTLCGLAMGEHPWVLLERNVPRMLANRDEEGRFMTWVLADDEPDVVSSFRIEADPVVNANVIAYLGDRPETRDAQRWLEALVVEDDVEGRSKWYPDKATVYYAITRAMLRARPALERLRPLLADRILGLRDAQGDFGNILQTAQALSALYNVDGLGRIDLEREVERFVGAQNEDGSWPELLAFGDQSLSWGGLSRSGAGVGGVASIGHGSESVTSAFCIEALERLSEVLSA